MENIIEAFKKHWLSSMLGLCSVIAVATWGVASVAIERPLRDQMALKDQQVALWKDRLAISDKQLESAMILPAPHSSTREISSQPPRNTSTPQLEPGAASGTCSVLEAGNKLYIERRFPEAIDTYLTAQKIDKLGKTPCIASIYATIGTIYALIGEPLMASNPVDAAKNLRLANNYNRAFAAALMCQHGDCGPAAGLWDQ